MHMMTSASVYKGELVEEILINFRNLKPMVFRNVPNTVMDYYVKIRVYKDSLKDNLIEWDVYFGRIPTQEHSLEVTINWEAYNIANKGGFYTDSNGYKMVHRQAVMV